MSNVIKARHVVAVAGDATDQDQAAPTPEPVSGGSDLAALARLLLAEGALSGYAIRKGQRALEAARADADAIVKAAEKRRDELLDQFRKEGFAEGYEAGTARGRADGREELKEQLALLTSAAEAAGSLRQELLTRHYEDVVELAVSLAAKLVRRTGGLDADTARQLLDEMVPRAAGSQKLVVRLNPADLKALEAELRDFPADVAREAEVSFVADGRLGSGDVVVETEQGGLDGTGPVRARRLVQRLLDVIEHGD